MEIRKSYVKVDTNDAPEPEDILNEVIDFNNNFNMNKFKTIDEELFSYGIVVQNQNKEVFPLWYIITQIIVVFQKLNYKDTVQLVELLKKIGD